MKQLSNEKKKEMLNHHFLYEIDQIAKMVKHHTDIVNSVADKQFAINIVVNTITLHGRNLFEFLYEDKEKLDYARAQQFIKEEKDWKKLRPPLTDSLIKLRKRVNYEISHLTYRRIKGRSKEKLWDLETLYDDLMKVICIFMENVDEEYIEDDLRVIRERYC